MEQSTIDQSIYEQSSIELKQKSIDYLSEISKWAKFLSILGFIVIGLLIIGGIAMGGLSSAMSPYGGAGMGFLAVIIYLAIALLYFFPIYYLFRFSSFASRAVNNRDSSAVEPAFENLKSHYKFMGILAIVIISLYLLIFIFAGAFGRFLIR